MRSTALLEHVRGAHGTQRDTTSWHVYYRSSIGSRYNTLLRMCSHDATKSTSLAAHFTLRLPSPCLASCFCRPGTPCRRRRVTPARRWQPLCPLLTVEPAAARRLASLPVRLRAAWWPLWQPQATPTGGGRCALRALLLRPCVREPGKQGLFLGGGGGGQGREVPYVPLGPHGTCPFRRGGGGGCQTVSACSLIKLFWPSTSQ